MEGNDNSKKNNRNITLNKIEESPFIKGSRAVNANKKPPPTWKQNLDYYFSQYCGASSIHGVQYLGERGRFIAEKIFWAIIIIVVWCLCILLICKTYNKWVTTPAVVTFSTTETSISTIPFPAITICPTVKSDPNIFNFTDVFLKRIQRREITELEKEQYEAFSLICAGPDFQLLEQGLDKGNKTVNYDTIFQHLYEGSPQVADIELYWLGKSISLEDLTLSLTSDGFCYTFNMLTDTERLTDPKEFTPNRSKKRPKTKKWSLDGGYPANAKMDTFPRRTFVSGMNGGLQILIPTNGTHLDYLCGEMLQGFKVTLHHPCENPDMDQHFRMPLDQAVLVAVKPRMIEISDSLVSYTPKDRKCYLGHERSLAVFKSYTQQNCLEECLLNYTQLQCGCVPFYMRPIDNDTEICGPGSEQCVEESKVNYLSNSKCNCLPACTSLEYDVEISQTDWNWRGMFQAFESIVPNSKRDPDYKSMHMSMMVVYYKEMQFLTSQRNELYGYVDFFSNTGGLLGLFIGFSVTSAIEILYFLSIRLGFNIRKFGKIFWSGEPELINSKDAQNFDLKEI